MHSARRYPISSVDRLVKLRLLIAVHRIRLAGVLLIALLVPALAACSGESDDGLKVTGQVVSVTPRTIAEFETLVIEDEDGKLWEFEGGLFSGFTPSHLDEHKALQEPVIVWYEQTGESLRVTRIEDG